MPPAVADGVASAEDGDAFMEKEHETYERLIEQMNFLRDRGDSLAPEARREKAASAALEMMKLFGDEDGDADDEDEDDSASEAQQGPATA